MRRDAGAASAVGRGDPGETLVRRVDPVERAPGGGEFTVEPCLGLAAVGEDGPDPGQDLFVIGDGLRAQAAEQRFGALPGVRRATKIPGPQLRGFLHPEVLDCVEQAQAGAIGGLHGQATLWIRSAGTGPSCFSSISDQASRRSRTRFSTSTTGSSCFRWLASKSRRM
jgi:hypothetical protein